MEIKLWEGEFPFTPEWYTTREHAPHLDQPIHQPRLHRVAELAHLVCADFDVPSVVDLGCGDGGLLSLLGDIPSLKVPPWGYDLMEVNVEHAVTVRGVQAEFCDFLNEDITWGQLATCTEVLEHLEDPHGWVRKIVEHCDFLIASSPSNETAEHHDGAHAWVWDMEGYRLLMEQAGYTVIDHQIVEGDYEFQVIMCGML